MDMIFEEAKWIACPKNDKNINFCPIFRKEFKVNEKVISATLTICGLGYHHAKINGKKVTDEYLAPAFTRFDKRIYYSEYKADDLVLIGDNVLTVELGRGFYAMNTPNCWNHEKSVWHDEPKLICTLKIETVNRTQIIISDESFKTTAGATTRACLYTGETVDTRIAEKLCGWERSGFDTDDWYNSIIAKAPIGELQPTFGPPIRILAEYLPIKKERIAKNVILVTFPYNISGWCHIKARGKENETLKIRYGEKLFENKRINLNTGFIEGEFQVDEYIFSKSGEMDFEPKFSYKGFQFVELIGDVELIDITAKLVASDVKVKSEFNCSCELLNGFYNSIIRTIQNNLHTIPTDTPIYEKNGWIGDAGLIAKSSMINFNIKTFWEKWLLDISDCMHEDGEIPLIVPTSDWGYSYSPEWYNAVYEIVWQLFISENDKSILKNNFEILKKIALYELSLLNENGLSHSVLGDWNPPGIDGNCGPESSEITSGCYLYNNLNTLSKIAEIIGKFDDMRLFGQKASDIATLMNEYYFDFDNGCYKTPTTEYRQVVDILTLTFGITPVEYRQKRIDALKDDLIKRNYHLNTGILGTKHLLPLLSQQNLHELAYKIAVQTTYPSWGFWIENGATTFYESWELDKRSRNHYMFGTILDWMVEYLVGLKIDFKNIEGFIISPKPTKDLQFCRYKTKIKNDDIIIDWQIIGNDFILKTEFSQNTKATIILPDNTEIQNAKSGEYRCKLIDFT